MLKFVLNLFTKNGFNFVPVPKAQHLVYTQIPFYLTNLSSTEEVIEVITVRVVSLVLEETNLLRLNFHFFFLKKCDGLFIRLTNLLRISLFKVC